MTIAQEVLFNIHEVTMTDNSWKDVEQWKKKQVARGATKFVGRNWKGHQEFWAVDSAKDKLISAMDVKTLKITYDIDQAEADDRQSQSRK